MRKRPARAAFCGLLAVTLVGAACGAQDNSGTVSEPAAPASTATTTAAANDRHDGTAATAAESTAGAGSETLPDGSIVCRPGGEGPFPAVLYNHGGKGTAVGGDLDGTCQTLADAGYVARSEKRPATVSLAGHLDDVLAALTALRARSDVDPDRVGIMGYSRGGLLTLQAALARPGDVRAVLLLAPAPGNGSLAATLLDVSALTAPVHVYVAENDLIQDNLVQLARDVESALTAAGKAVTLTIYPPFGSDGHTLFDEVREPYWSDVLAVLDSAVGG